MFRNQYDNDITVWSPKGRIHQIEYAMKAVKQGTAVVGLKSRTHVVLVALKRSPSKLSGHQEKVFKMDTHVGVGVSGLTADGRVLSRFIQDECMQHKYKYDSPMPVSRVVEKVGIRCQKSTNEYGTRPYGVGLLIAGLDSTGTHLYQTCPSGNYFDYYSTVIGARFQAAKTYLEKNFEVFDGCTLDELVKHGVRALKSTLQDEDVLSAKNTTIGVVGIDRNFAILGEAETSGYIEDEGEAVAGDEAQMEL